MAYHLNQWQTAPRVGSSSSSQSSEALAKCIMLIDAERRLVDRLTPADAVTRLGIPMRPWVKSTSPRQPLTPADLAKATTSWGLQTSVMAPVRQLLDWPIDGVVDREGRRVLPNRSLI